MPLTYVNPAKKPGHKGRAHAARNARKRWGRYGSAKKTRSLKRATTLPNQPKKKRRHKKVSRAASAAKKNPHKRKKKIMAKKLYGAAARAHAKKLRRSKKRKHGGKRKSGRRSAAARKAARTRKANKAMRRAAAKKGARRRRHGGHRKHARRRNPKHAHRARRRRHNPGHRKHARRRNPKHAHRARRRRNPRPATQRSLLRARRSIRSRHKTSLARATMRRYHMRSNPGFGDVMDLFKQVIPVALSLYGARAASSKLATSNIPGLNQIPAQYQGIAMSGVVVVGAHFLTKAKMLQKYRGAVMIGTGINLVDQILMAFAPPTVKQLFGLSDYVEIGGGMSDYIAVGDVRPIDDDITLRDYVEVGAVQEELGVEEELGLEEELGGALDRAYLGGVSSSSMLKTIPTTPMLAPVPERSFTRNVRKATSMYDSSDDIYGGIFRGDW